MYYRLECLEPRIIEKTELLYPSRNDDLSLGCAHVAARSRRLCRTQHAELLRQDETLGAGSPIQTRREAGSKYRFILARSIHETDRSFPMARTKPPSDKVLTIRLPTGELERLEHYCIQRGKTKTDVLREMIRKLRV